eukprot:1159227-Pelagomonas_calceolata.AAC.9
MHLQLFGAPAPPKPPKPAVAQAEQRAAPEPEGEYELSGPQPFRLMPCVKAQGLQDFQWGKGSKYKLWSVPYIVLLFLFPSCCQWNQGCALYACCKPRITCMFSDAMLAPNPHYARRCGSLPVPRPAPGCLNHSSCHEQRRCSCTHPWQGCAKHHHHHRQCSTWSAGPARCCSCKVRGEVQINVYAGRSFVSRMLARCKHSREAALLQLYAYAWLHRVLHVLPDEEDDFEVTFDDLEVPTPAPKPAGGAGGAPAAPGHTTPAPTPAPQKPAPTSAAATPATTGRPFHPNSRTYVLGGGGSGAGAGTLGAPTAIPGLGAAAAAPQMPSGPGARPAVPPGLQANRECYSVRKGARDPALYSMVALLWFWA